MTNAFLIRPFTADLLNLPERDLGTEDAVQVDLLLHLTPSGGYENIITAIDVFPRYLFAYPVTDAFAIKTPEVILDILTKHSYLPTTLIIDEATAITSELVAKVA